MSLLKTLIKGVDEKLMQHDIAISDARIRAELIESNAIPKLASQLESFDKSLLAWGEKIQTLSDTVASVSPKLDALTTGDGPMNTKADSISENSGQNYPASRRTGKEHQ